MPICKSNKLLKNNLPIDPMAVVDNLLRVRGVKGVRVADASIMPEVTSGNTNAPSIMIGERVVDFIRNNR